MNQLWIDASERLEATAMDWWEVSKRTGTPGAVKWLSNDTTGALVIVTRGEYADSLKQYVMGIEAADVPQSVYQELAQRNAEVKLLRLALARLGKTLGDQQRICDIALAATGGQPDAEDL